MELLLFDLDGTLLTSQKTISEKTKLTLNKCREKNILLGFSTSRGYINILPYIDAVNPDVIICNGGAAVYYHNKLLHTESFSLDETHRILSAAYSVCGEKCEITLDTLDKVFWNRTTDKSTNYMPDSLYDDFKNFPESALKICVQTEDAEAAEKIASVISECDYLPFSDIPWYKFSPSKATKETAIKFISDFLSVPVENITAFGDDFNDMGMLRLCGTGVAMGNAIVQLKQIADETTVTNDEDGVAVYLEKKFGL